MKKIALLTLLLINLSLSFSLPRNQASPAIFSVTKTNNSILFRHTDSTLTAIPCQSVASIVSNADPSKIVSVWVVQQGDYDKIMQFDYSVCGFSSKSDAVDSLTAWSICDTSSGGGGGSQTLSISGDTLSISDGNSVVLPVYIQIDSSTINSYDVLNSQNAPPGSPSTGDVYLVGNVPTGAWVGHAKDIAEWDGADWVFTDGVQGDFLYNATNALTYIFRSGNWVQTTGVPALNNGNNISGGLKIGTNNARSLTFETNNVNRGRIDSIGRFYVYDTSLRKANKYLQIDSITGRLIASDISGGGGGGSDLATLIDACPNVDVETLDGSETFPILKDDTVYQLSLGAFAELVGGGGIPDAPNDGQLYGRQSENWSVVPDAELPSTDSLEFFTDTSTTFPGSFMEYLGSKVKGRDIGTSGFTTYHRTLYGNGYSYSTMGNASSYILIDDNNDVHIEAQFGKLKIYPPNWNSQPYGSVLTLIGANGECEWQSVLRGTATLSSGTVTVSTASIHTGYKIYVSVDTPSGTQGFLSAPTGSIVDGTSFVINSTSATDDSTVNWWIAP